MIQPDELEARLDAVLDEQDAPTWAADLPEELPRPDDAIGLAAPGEAAATVTKARERWRITNDDEAEWAMRRLARAHGSMSAIDAKLAERIERLTNWADAERREPARRAQFFAALLEDYGVRVRSEDEERKTLRFPSGVVSTTRSKPKIRLGNAERLLAWAKQHRPDWVKVEETVLISTVQSGARIAETTEREPGGPAYTVRTVVTKEGEPIEGVEVEPGGVTAKPKPA